MRKVLKIILWVLGSIILVLLAVCIWLNTPSGKNFVRQQAVNFLHKKLKTEVYIGEVGSFFREQQLNPLPGARKQNSYLILLQGLSIL